MSEAQATPAAPAPAAKPKKRRLLLKFVALCALLAVCAFAFRNFLVRKGVETAVTEVTGFPLQIGSIDIGIRSTRVEIRGLRLSNPEGFEDPRCLHGSRIVADLEGRSLLGKELHIEELDVNVQEVVVVKNAKGETNLDRLTALGGDGKEPAKEKKGKALKWRCDRMHLRMDRVVFLDFTKAKGGKPKEEVWNLQVNENFKDVTGPDQVVRIIVWKVIANTPIRLATATVETLTEGVVGLGEGAVNLVKGVGGAIGGLFGGGEEEKPPPPKDEKKKR